MDFRLKVFHSVATNLSFTKASKELFISQPAISKHIHELEVQYKTPLFDRVGSRIGLTHAGELLLSHTKQLLAAYRQMDFETNLLTDNFAGELRLGASTTISQYVLPPVLASFIKKFPEIKVSLLNGNSRDIEQALREGKITLGLVEGTAHQSTLHYTPFMKTNWSSWRIRAVHWRPMTRFRSNNSVRYLLSCEKTVRGRSMWWKLLWRNIRLNFRN